MKGYFAKINYPVVFVIPYERNRIFDSWGKIKNVSDFYNQALSTSYLRSQVSLAWTTPTLLQLGTRLKVR